MSRNRDGGLPRLTAEWEPQQRILLAWPHPDTDWAPVLGDIEAEYLDLALAILPRSPVTLCCRDERHARNLRSLFRHHRLDAGRVSLVVVPYDDTWIRDYGPLSLITAGGLELVDFAFNGWGGRHPSRLDDRVSAALHQSGALGGLSMRRLDRVLEGGSIDCDGRGTVIATSRCLLNPNRGADGQREAVERELMTWLGTDRILWLEHGELAGDDTDGHIDMLARFCDEGTIVFSACEDQRDPNFESLRQMHEQLKSFTRRDGDPYRLVPLPLPRAVRNSHGRRLPASYTNFLIVNGAVIVPTYADPGDQQALDTLGRCFPGREVVGVRASTLISQGGGVHCATLQLAACPRRNARRAS